MNRWIVSAALTAALPFTLAAQNSGAAFQYVFTGSGDPIRVNTLQKVENKGVTGHPLTATEEHHTLQILGDGTHIESKSTDKFYRDDQGRFRTEHEDGTVQINDVVAGTSIEISANGKTNRRSSGASFSPNKPEVELKLKTALDNMKAQTQAQTPVLLPGRVTLDNPDVVSMKLEAEAKAKAAEQQNEENLGIQTVNGVLAQGTRTTTTIPAGKIGNDRPIQIVSERWFSSELQMLIRSTNKDPRFGETTYDLTVLGQGAPDPALFQIPARQ